MAGGHMKYRHLGRDSAHRQALLRNLVTSLFEHESISTTWPKAKEAQRLAEKLITLGKRNTEHARRRAMAVFFKPKLLLPKLFGPLRHRYADRPGGYTRVLRIEPLKTDQAPSAILELVDGPRDMRFAMTAAALARQRETGMRLNETTALNVSKVTRFREGGEEELEAMVKVISAQDGGYLGRGRGMQYISPSEMEEEEQEQGDAAKGGRKKRGRNGGKQERKGKEAESLEVGEGNVSRGPRDVSNGNLGKKKR